MRLATRLMLALAYVLILAIVALEIPLAVSIRNRVNDEVRFQARVSARVTAATAGVLVANDRDARLPQLAAAASSARGRVLIVDERGFPIADSAAIAQPKVSYAARPEIAAALRGKEVQILRSSETLNQQVLATATPMVNNGKVLGAVRVTQSINAQKRAVNRAMAGLVAIGLAVLLAGLAVGALIARQIALPLRRFEAAARQVEEGDLSARAPIVGSTEQQSLAEAFNDMTARLERLVNRQQMFIADASHQLRTPLAGLRLRLEEAQARSDQTDVNDQIDHGIKELDRLSEMIDDLLVLSSAGEAGAQPQKLSVHELAQSLVDRWQQYAATTQHQLNLELLGEDSTVSASRGDIDRAIDALLENALHYSPSNTIVTITASGNSITIDDQGAGLTDDDIDQLFERFHRGSAGRAGTKGTGLGLAIARELARQWQADISIRALPGGGTRASIEFSSGSTTPGGGA